MVAQMPLEGGVHLHHAQEAICRILDDRLIQRQYGDLRRAINAQIFLEFLRQVQACNIEWFKRQRIRESILIRRVSARDQQYFEEKLCKLQQIIECFSREISALGSWVIHRSRPQLVTHISSSHEITESHKGYGTFELFRDAFNRNVEAILEGTEAKKKNELPASRKFGAVYMDLWTAAHA